MKFVLLILTLGLGLTPALGYADTVTVSQIQPDNSQNMLLKKINEKLGNRLVAVVIDGEGHEQRIFITSEDAVEIKRGLWVIRPGTYQIDI